MTTQQNRQPAGVPTGGQFAASAHAESGVTLANNTPRTPTPTEQAHSAIAKMKREVDRLEDLRTILHARDEARRLFGPEVRFLHPVEDDGSDTEPGIGSLHFVAYDENGEHIDEGFAEGFTPLSGQGLPADLYGSTGEWLDMAALEQVDLAREVRDGEMRLACDAITRNAIESFILDEDIVNTQIDEDMTCGLYDDYLGPDDEITDEERRQILAEFDPRRVDFEPVLNDFTRETERAARAVLERTRSDR